MPLRAELGRSSPGKPAPPAWGWLPALRTCPPVDNHCSQAYQEDKSFPPLGKQKRGETPKDTPLLNACLLNELVSITVGRGGESRQGRRRLPCTLDHPSRPARPSPWHPEVRHVLETCSSSSAKNVLKIKLRKWKSTKHWVHKAVREHRSATPGHEGAGTRTDTQSTVLPGTRQPTARVLCESLKRPEKATATEAESGFVAPGLEGCVQAAAGFRVAGTSHSEMAVVARLTVPPNCVKPFAEKECILQYFNHTPMKLLKY